MSDKKTTFYSPITSTKVLAPPGGGNSEEKDTQPLRVLAPPGGRASLDLWGGYGNDEDAKPRRRSSGVQQQHFKREELVAATPERKTRNILVSTPPGGASSISLGWIGVRC